MVENPPVVYLLHGEDEFAITQFVADVKTKLGDPGMAEMNFTILDGRSLTLEEFATATMVLPFMVKRRLVLLDYPLAFASHPDTRQKFIELLDKIPSSTALIVIENHTLTGDKDREAGRFHWLEDWALAAHGRAFIRQFGLKKGRAMSGWIQERARDYGGQFSYRAADHLTELVGTDTRLADQEIQKLILYVNFQRPVLEEDVEFLTPFAGDRSIFELVDALGNRNGRIASEVYHRLLQEQDPLSIFGMIVRQFRLILLAKEILDSGGGQRDVAKTLAIHNFVAKKIVDQARNFDLLSLEAIYRRLLGVDESIKTGQMDPELSLDVLIAGLTL